jgi:3-oxoacyl-[acyl-carrier-protein] synthase-1
MGPPVAISRCALLTPLDAAEHTTWEAIQAGRRVASRTAVADEFLAGEASLDRSIRLALGVAQRALPRELARGTVLFCGTSKGPVGVMLEACRQLNQGQALSAAAAEQVALGVGAMGSILQRELATDHDGGAVTSVAACSSGLHALHRAAQALWRGECGRALVVAADASLHPLFAASFQRLGVLAPADARGVRRCVPFGASGAGFFLIEAAVALLLEAAPATPPLAFLEETWIGGDSTALVAIDERGVSLRAGLAACMPAADGLAFVHAHATGTGHDAFERAAIQAVCGAHVPTFSHKAWLGHALGAAGLVSVALSALCHQQGRTLEGLPIAPQRPSLTIAQGFGGHIAVARLRR